MAQHLAPIGPNDHHVAADGRLQPGLGSDQPKAAQADSARLAGEARLAALRAEVAAQAEGLTEREQELAGKQAELEAREKALAAREAAAAKK